MMIGTIIFLILGSLFFAYRAGKKSVIADQAEAGKKVVGNINEFNRREDEEVKRQIDRAGDNPVSSVTAPSWLPNRE
jgi:hypothetical protein